MVLTFLFVMAAITWSGSAQQEPCTLGLDKAPAIRGIKLGMTDSEVRALDSNLPKNAGVDLTAAIDSVKAFEPGLPETRDESGYSAIIYFAGLDRHDKKLEGVDKLVLLFFGGKLVHINVSYKEPRYWREVLETAGPLNLPSQEGYAKRKCDGFTLTLFQYSDHLTLYLTVLHVKKDDPIGTAGSSARDIQTEVEKAAPRIAEVIQKAEDSFRIGKLNLGAGKRSEAREHFDRAVDEILNSGIDVRASQELRTYFLDLVERIYREEVPIYIPSRQSNVIELVAQNGQSPAAPNPPPQIGFVDQKFEPTRLDRLSELVLTPEDNSILEGSSDGTTMAGLRGEYLRATRDYRMSLEKLLISYQRSLQKAEFRLAQSEKLYSDGRILKSQVDEARSALQPERDRVTDTRKKIGAVDKQIAAALAAARAKKPVADSTLMGPPPAQLPNGQVPAVIRYLHDNLNDPYSMRLLKWSKVQKVTKYGASYWYVSLRMRAKNGFGAYILKDTGFYIRHNKVVFTENL